ncbi:MAG: solute:sodium symporter family transporter [Bacteroidetes bacterium]|jgi:SSS family solute:Na+ symporter|nr:solute:sodium symporter family transporter [Bacteroidota bacterium]
MWIFASFVGFTLFVAFYSWYRLRGENLYTSDGYFLGGRSLSAGVIAGSMMLTNISSEHLIGMNGSAYKNGMIIISWETTATIGLIFGALYLVPRYLKMGLSTIPKFLELRFDRATRSLAAILLVFSFVFTLLPIVLYTGAINFEGIFEISSVLGVTHQQSIWILVVIIGVIGALYSILGGLKAVAVADTVNGIGLIIGGLLIPILALWEIGNGNLLSGVDTVYNYAPEKFSIVGAPDSVLPFSAIFTGLVINQIYFWSMHQSIIQRALGAKDLVAAQKGLLLTGVFKLLIPIIIALPGVIGFYYFGDSMYDNQDFIYPMMIHEVLPVFFIGIFAAVFMGAVLSTFNSVINSAATIYTIDIYKIYINKDASERKMVMVGTAVSTIVAVFAIFVAPFMSYAPEGIYQLLQTLNGLFFVPLGTTIIAGFFLKKISAAGVKVALVIGMVFYGFTELVVDIGIHFVHVWGIMFVGMIIIMYIVSYFYPVEKEFQITDVEVVDISEWKYAKVVSIFLIVVTIGIYILLWGPPN